MYINQSHCVGLVVALCLITNVAREQQLWKTNEVTKLIDHLTELDQPDIGYSGSVTGSAFLPLGQSEIHAILFGQKPNTPSDTLKSLVKLGVRALPTLLKHLNDNRPTKIVVSHWGFGGGFPGEERRYTITVGDLCYVAIGQIVNRDYWAVRYQPSGIVLVNSVPECKKLQEDVIKEWADLTPDKHRDSLIRDVLAAHEDDVRNGASLRLAYYYPAALETTALKHLARPTYPAVEVRDLIQNRLYPAKTAKDRKVLVEEFVGRYGEIARDGIRWSLFADLEMQEFGEGDCVEPELRPQHLAQQCLVDLFGLRPNVKSKERPGTRPLDDVSQSLFIRTLRYDEGEKLDQVLRDVLAKTDDDYVAMGCLDRLVGRGYDIEIEAFLKRRLPQMKDSDRKEFLAYEAKLGWTRLHAAVDLDVLELVQSVLKQNVPVDAAARDGRTALHVAAAKGTTHLIAVLLNAKANPNVKDQKGRLAAQLAAHEDHAEIVKQLVAKGSNVPDVFVAATIGGTDRLAAMLKESPESVKLRNGEGLTPLHVAAREGHAEAVRALVAAGAEVDAFDDQSEFGRRHTDGWTPLHLAAMAGKTTTSALLLDHGANVNAVDRRGKHTALHFASWAGHTDMVTMLLERNAERNAKDTDNRTPLDLANEKGHSAVIKLLE